jgi:hypothetical protein
MTSKKEGGSHIEYMHRAIWEHHNGLVPEGMEIDHANGNRLDNRIENLRICTHQQNLANKHTRTIHTSRFKGVSLYRDTGRWRATMGYMGKAVHIGYFDSEEEAARAYDAKARELQGEYANTNFQVVKQW